MKLTGSAVFAFLDFIGIAEAGDFARRVEELGYNALWFTEGPSARNALVQGAFLLSRTERITIGTGVASVWARGATAMAAAAWTSAEASGGRFALGIGINNPVSASLHGGNYARPLAFMAEYVTALKAFKYTAAGSADIPPIVIGAQYPRMLELAGKVADGAITYFGIPPHTARARQLVGANRWLVAEQAVIMERDPSKARRCAREYMAFYLAMPAYRKFFIDWGFKESDLGNGGSDRLVDMTVAWGEETKIRDRLEQHRRAGADQVCILPLTPEGGRRPHLRVLEVLAPSRSA